ncbi:akirin-2-like [Babylonia areolata]|uniref:akirin-2-like n=1 Tax=Babylonia areolata TaxID=304850 RepID=UPI003FD15D9F
MACAATLKRSLEFDPVHSPSHSSPKRRRCLPMTITPSPPPAKFNRTNFSPFSGVAEKLSTEKIAASIAQEVKRMQRRRQLHFPLPTTTPGKSESPSCSTSPDHCPQASQSLNNLFSSLPHTKKDVPLFTFRQVSLICERLIREREEEVNEQYDKVLNCKLAEQYESFLKFNHDQLHRRFGKSEMSYVS